MAEINDRTPASVDTGANSPKNFAEQATAVSPGVGGKQEVPGGLLDKVQTGAESVVQTAGQFASQARERVGEYAGQVGETVQHWAEGASDRAGHLAKNFGHEVSGLIRRHPVQSLLVGFGIGLLFSRVRL